MIFKMFCVAVVSDSVGLFGEGPGGAVGWEESRSLEVPSSPLLLNPKYQVNPPAISKIIKVPNIACRFTLPSPLFLLLLFELFESWLLLSTDLF